jgi:glycosyltransferase involved in cell wall biosynthesis
MITIYPPVRDGIAAYAVQTVKRLRAEGHDVEVLSPGPSAAHHHLDLVGPRGALALARRVRDYDKVIVQFHPDVFYPHPASWQQRAVESAALEVAWRAARQLELRVHEVDYEWGKRRIDGRLARRMFRAADRIVVHTDAEAEQFVEAFKLRRDRIEVTAHGADFERRVDMTRDEARRVLGLPADEFMFLAIGFIQPHKGFDRAIRAFAGLHGARLDVVGSVRVEEPDYVRHLEELEQLAAQTPGAHVHAGFVTDDAFDQWIVASDTVVLPYRSIWSSGVLERAALYDRPVIATRVGGLAAQAEGHGDVTVVDDDQALAAAMRARLGQAAPAPVSGDWAVSGGTDRNTVMAEIRSRAAALRGARPAATGTTARGVARPSDASAPLRRTAPLGRPAPISDRPGAGVLKRITRRLIDWEVAPIVHQVNSLREATIKAVEDLAADESD